jgi:hypothetical protein
MSAGSKPQSGLDADREEVNGIGEVFVISFRRALIFLPIQMLGRMKPKTAHAAAMSTAMDTSIPAMERRTKVPAARPSART